LEEHNAFILEAIDLPTQTLCKKNVKEKNKCPLQINPSALISNIPRLTDEKSEADQRAGGMGEKDCQDCRRRYEI